MNRTWCVYNIPFLDKILSQSMLHNIFNNILVLALETGRLNATPEEDRLCLLCEPYEIDKEVHFLFCCPKMSSIYVDLFWLDYYEIQ